MAGEIRDVTEIYHLARRKAEDLLALHGIEPSESGPILTTMQKIVLTEHPEGFGNLQQLADSFAAAARYLGTRGRLQLSRRQLDYLYLLLSFYGELPYNVPYVALPGALAALEALRAAEVSIVVVTKGNHDWQLSKIREVGMQRGVHYDEVHVVARKSEGEWAEIVRTYVTSPSMWSRCWAIGNSIRADVNPLVRRGANGVWLRRPVRWEYEEDELWSPEAPAQVHVVKDFHDVLPILGLSVAIVPSCDSQRDSHL